MTSQILKMNPLLSVEQAYFVVIREEQHCVVAQDKGSQAEAIAFGARTTEQSYVLCDL